MRQVVTTSTGGIDALKVEQRPDPVANQAKLLLEFEPQDSTSQISWRGKALCPDAPPTPCVMGYEVSGVVEKLGEGVNSDLAGKSVVALTRFGGQSELIAVKATQMFGKPLTFEQAEAIPVNPHSLCVACGYGFTSRRRVGLDT